MEKEKIRTPGPFQRKFLSQGQKVESFQDQLKQSQIEVRGNLIARRSGRSHDIMLKQSNNNSES